MSKLFYDKHVKLEKLDGEIKKIVKTEEERLEFWQIIDEIIHHKILGCIFEKLPEKHHDEFLDKYHKTPHDESIFEYLLEKIGEDIKDFIKKEVLLIEYELLEELGVLHKLPSKSKMPKLKKGK
ncbi:hypothetical protein ACFL0F_01405 [Patescibacteria group bacterium]